MELSERVPFFRERQTPFYFYDLARLYDTLNACKAEADRYGYHVHYAVKANANPRIMKEIQALGFGADCVSGNEITASLKTGFPPGKIVFAGVGKTDKEIQTGLNAGIFSFNVESIEELTVLNDIAGKLGKTASIALRLNPNVDPKTHAYVTTGLEENKFGINPWEYDRVLGLLPHLKNLRLTGFHFHIGSQITDLEVYKNLCIRVKDIQQYFYDRNIVVKHLNMGGGLGVDYAGPDSVPVPPYDRYFKVFNDFLEPLPGQQIHFELGRSLVANCGNLISRVLYVKHGVQTNFAILDAGMTELIRPALYGSFHKIENLSKARQPNAKKYDVVGPICETSDTFGKAIDLPETERGDLIAIRSAGAYGEVMSSGFNLRERADTVFAE